MLPHEGDAKAAAKPSAPARHEKPASGGLDSSTLRVSVEKVDQLINLVGELVITQAMLAQNSKGGDADLNQQMLAGLAGMLHSLKDGYVNPELLSWHQSGNVLLMVILGGPGTFTGAALGALPAGVRLAADGMNKVFAAKDARASLLPAGLGAKNGEFNKVFIDTFARIVLRNEDIKTVLADQGKTLGQLMRDANAPCWAPDASSAGAPCPVAP